MKRLLAVLGAATAVLVWLPTQTQAQGGAGGGAGGGGGGGFRNMDPAQARQQMMDRIRENMDIKSDDEWKVIEPRIQKVMDAQREARFGGGMRMFFGRGGRGPGGPGGGGGGRGFGPEPSQAAQELQNALESKDSTDTIKAKLTAYREERAQKQAALQKAQEDLKKVLTVKQEAALVLAGMLE
jgi:Spy/CpxP family protein refolding chaperone